MKNSKNLEKNEVFEMLMCVCYCEAVVAFMFLFLINFRNLKILKSEISKHFKFRNFEILKFSNVGISAFRGMSSYHFLFDYLFI